MPKRKAKSSSSRAHHVLSLDDDTPTNPNPNPNIMNKQDDDEIQQIQIPPIPIIDSQDEIPKSASDDVKDEPQVEIPDKDESFDGDQPVEVDPEALRNVTTRRSTKRRKNINPTEEEEEEGSKDVVVDVKDSLDDTADVVVKEEHIPTSSNHEIHDKGEDLEAESDNDEDEENQDEHEEETKEEGMNDSSPLKLPPVHGEAVFNCNFDDDNNNPTATNVSKQVPKKNTKSMRRKKSMNARKKAALDKKMELFRKKLEDLKKNFEPIAFRPEKKLNFSKHEGLFKRLGLWDFVQMELDVDLWEDGIALLVANYDHTLRSSEVNGCRIKVNRADLARALNLPVKKEKGVVSGTSDVGSGTLSEEEILFMEEFVSAWILLHEDVWMLPKEVGNWTALIKNGEPHKVDWTTLIWFMVEKELKAAPEVGTLYYASHLQCLMKSQRKDLFSEEARQGDPMDEGEVGVDLKIGSSDGIQEQQIEERIDLCLGQSKNENEQQYNDTVAMEYQGTQESCGQAEWHMEDKSRTHESGCQEDWLMEDKNHENDHSLRRCNLSDTQDLESLDMLKKEAENDNGCDPQSEEADVDDSISADLLRGIGATNVTYSQSFHHPGPSSGAFLHAVTDMHLNTGGTSVFPNTCKRENSHDDFVDDHIMNGYYNNNKRMRHDGSLSEFSLVMQKIKSLTEKATLMYEEKAETSMYEQHFLGLQQQNVDLLNNLHNAQLESQRKDKLIYKLEHELHLMTSLLEGYRKALKENRRVFSEYREHNPKPEEPLYKDAGPGGLVLSTIEIERQCHMYKHFIETSAAEWFQRLEAWDNDVRCMNEKLLGMEENVRLLKGKPANPETGENSTKEV